jgi:hypothetical protein
MWTTLPAGVATTWLKIATAVDGAKSVSSTWKETGSGRRLRTVMRTDLLQGAIQHGILILLTAEGL